MNYKILSLLAIALLSTGLLFFSGNGIESSPTLSESPISEQMKMWHTYKTQFGQYYASEEEESFRFENFKQNLQKISDHNSDETLKYKLGLTKFSDLTSSEFMSMYLPAQPTPRSQQSFNHINATYFDNQKQLGATKKREFLTQSYDWCSQGDCPPIGDMGQCTGGSYAWAAVQGIESLYAVKKGVNVSLSVEQVLQCSSGYGNNGCTGGTVMDAFLYNEHNKLTTSNLYPYVSSNGVTGNCNDAAASQGSYALQNVNIIPPICEYIANDLEDNPISICLTASEQFQQYTSGIFPSNECSSDSATNLCMLLVGVQYQNFWYLQNAWGTGWGMGGMMQLEYGNSCGICGNAWQPQFNLI